MWAVSYDDFSSQAIHAGLLTSARFFALGDRGTQPIWCLRITPDALAAILISPDADMIIDPLADADVILDLQVNQFDL